MDVHLQQLARVAEFMSANADVLRDLMKERYFDDDASSLNEVAGELERLRDIVEKIHSGSGSLGMKC